VTCASSSPPRARSPEARPEHRRGALAARAPIRAAGVRARHLCGWQHRWRRWARAPMPRVPARPLGQDGAHVLIAPVHLVARGEASGAQRGVPGAVELLAGLQGREVRIGLGVGAGGRAAMLARPRREPLARLLRRPGVAAGRQPRGLQRGVPGAEHAQDRGSARPARPGVAPARRGVRPVGLARRRAVLRAPRPQRRHDLLTRGGRGAARGALAAIFTVHRWAAAARAPAGGEIALDGAHVPPSCSAIERTDSPAARNATALATRSRRGKSCSTTKLGSPAACRPALQLPKWCTTVLALGQRGCPARQRAASGPRPLEDHSCARGARPTSAAQSRSAATIAARSQLPGATAGTSRATPPARTRRARDSRDTPALTPASLAGVRGGDLSPDGDLPGARTARIDAAAERPQAPVDHSDGTMIQSWQAGQGTVGRRCAIQPRHEFTCRWLIAGSGEHALAVRESSSVTTGAPRMLAPWHCRGTARWRSACFRG
jgi:hypothetical protein